MAASWGGAGCLPNHTLDIATCHHILGVLPGASVDEIRAAFRRAALRTHPDKQCGSREAFDAVQRAFNTLQAVGPCPVTPSTASGPSAARASGWADGAEVWDPWSSGPAAASWDPWSSSAPAWDPWAAGGAAGAGEAATGSSPSSTAQRKKRRRTPSPIWRGRPEKRVAFDGSLMRNGVYGFRPDSSSESEEAALVAPGALKPSQAFSLSTVAACSSGMPSAPRPARKAARQCGQRKCARHNRLRFVTALWDDGDGNFICKPGQECP
mmetsp:Transcript_63247/g.120642  ORF Transcript_63247/g.120642 Transcript_63247/m.120642 type:complete len:267 (-) Transcript_63247:46-846(-)